ncbi:hypothetical protein CDL12_13241 [Handroanthus impetiginosus]|uniref:Uncharacterized protein n=1 Tax=Handroanthus impetiginosus TaxID=429701 RepID=A0A2G9H9C3_9LAMI|nr:hypothetical protein CDL12_13241 [Handroanthus impetiginosus]
MYNPKTQFSYTYNHTYANKDRILGQTNQASSNWCNDQEVVQFRPNDHEESDDSGVCSPPLWKNSPSPTASPSQPLLTHQISRSLSPKSRAQAIARGQKELMEMVKTMPESSYELSLRDLVENHTIETQGHQVERLNNSSLQQRGVGKVKRQESKNNEKNMGFENKGLFLKMVFPFNLGSKKKKNFGRNSSGKVSPKPGGGERDWWKKKFTGSSDSDSSRTSNNSGSSGSSGSSGGSSSDGGRSYGSRRKKNGFLTGCTCWPFLKSRSSKCEE